MGEAAAVWTFESRGLADIPAFKLYVVRASTRPLDDEDRAMIDLLEVSFVRRWTEALADVAPERADATALRLWAETKSAWRVYSPRLSELAQKQLESDAPIAEVLPGLVDEHLDEVLEHLPHLSASARIYVGAFLAVLEPMLVGEDARDGFEMALSGDWPDDPRFDEYMALLHGLAVAGFYGGVPDVVTTALASAFWARVRALVEDDQQELARIDAALTSAVREARRSSAPPVEAPPSAKQSVLVRMRQAATGAEQIWASLPRDGASNLDEHLRGR